YALLIFGVERHDRPRIDAVTAAASCLFTRHPDLLKRLRTSILSGTLPVFLLDRRGIPHLHLLAGDPSNTEGTAGEPPTYDIRQSDHFRFLFEMPMPAMSLIGLAVHAQVIGHLQ